MAGDNKINLPGGMGGLMRYDEEYDTIFKLTPAHVILFIILVIIFVTALKLFRPIPII